MPKTALLTPVYNPGIFGPGHSALVIGPKVYSFGDNGGWSVMASKTYMQNNQRRSVLVQHLDGDKVDGDAMFRYVEGSVNDNAWYVWNGLCSHQAAYAIDAATTDTFEPIGFNTPYAVAATVANKKYETDRYLVLATGLKTETESLKDLMHTVAKYPHAPVGQPKFFEWQM